MITPDDNGLTFLHYTCIYNYPKLVPVLLSAGADPNMATRSGQSALHLVAVRGHAHIASMLLTAGASALAKDNAGFMPWQR